MSGGYFNYQDSLLKDEIFGCSDKPKNVFEDREISELIFDVFDLMHEFDWYMSGDTGRDTYLNEKSKFKSKWLSNRGVRVRKIVDNSIAECKKELYETFEIEEGEKTDDE